MKKCLVLIPAYNEEKNLEYLFKEFKKNKKSFDILVINDGSSDNTALICKKYNIKYISHTQNLGIPQTVRTGLVYAVKNQYSMVIRLDGDGQHCPEDITELIKASKVNNADVVIGSRYTQGRSFKASLPRVFFSFLISKYIELLTGKKLHDPTSGFFLLNKRSYMQILKRHLENHYEPSIATFFLLKGFSVYEKKVQMRPRFSGTSSLSYLRGMVVGAIIVLQVTTIKYIFFREYVRHFWLLSRKKLSRYW